MKSQHKIQAEIPAFRIISWSSGESSVKCGTASAQSTTVCDSWLQTEFHEYGGIASISSTVCALSEFESIRISAEKMLSISISPPAVVLSASISPFSAPNRSSWTATVSNKRTDKLYFLKLKNLPELCITIPNFCLVKKTESDISNDFFFIYTLENLRMYWVTALMK